MSPQHSRQSERMNCRESEWMTKSSSMWDKHLVLVSIVSLYMNYQSSKLIVMGPLWHAKYMHVHVYYIHVCGYNSI